MMKKALPILSFLILNSACQNMTDKKQSSKNNTQSPIVKSAKVLELERRLKEREETVQDLKDQNRIASALRGQSGSTSNAAPQKSLQRSPSTLEVSPTLAVLPKTDYELYQDMQVQFERNNEVAFFSRANLFKKNFPKSHLMDEVLYLSGLMSLSNKNYASAVKFFNVVIQEHPSSLKASSAAFAKGVAFKRMNLRDEAKKVFSGIKSKYPGSVEAMRADGELKLLRK